MGQTFNARLSPTRMQAVQSPIIPIVGELIRQNPGTISLGQGVVSYGPPPQVTQAIAAIRQSVLASLNSPPDFCKVPKAEGAFYVLLKLNTHLSAMTLTDRLIKEHGVAVIPGTAFGMEQGCYLRVAYAALETQTVREG